MSSNININVINNIIKKNRYTWNFSQVKSITKNEILYIIDKIK